MKSIRAKCLRQLQKVAIAGFDVFLRLSYLIVVGSVCWMAFNKWLAEPAKTTILLFAILEGIDVLLFTLSRVPKKQDWNPVSITASLVTCYYFLLVKLSGNIRLIPEMAGTTLQVIGALIAVYSKLCLGRSFGLTAANRGVVQGGAYKFVRHPIYASYIITCLGFILTNFSLRNVAFYLILITLQLYRLHREELILSHDVAYQQYKQKVRYKLIFGVF